MDRIEYWFLDAAIEARVPVHVLVSPKCEGRIGRPPPGLSRAELVEKLEALLASGKIAAVRTWRWDEFVPERQELIRSLDPRNEAEELFCGVTAAGGALWEAVSCPQWDRFVTCGGRYDRLEIAETEVAGTRRETVERYFEGLIEIGYEPIEGTARWDVAIPWEATYWKKLSEGHVLRFRHAVPDVKGRPQWLIDMESWYTPPFEL